MHPAEDPNIFIHPRKGKNERTLPENGLLLVNPSEASACHQRLREQGGESRFLFNSALTVAEGGRLFVAGPAIGAPMATLCLEKCIALGAKRIILYGWCGAIHSELRVGDVVVPERALSGEGTSSYYPLDVPAAPSAPLRARLAELFSDSGMAVHGGAVWSTDAIYREDRRMLQQLLERESIVGVDMEFSALCTVACFRNIEFAAVLVVSDELWGPSWRPGFAKQRFHSQKEKALASLLGGLGNSFV